MARKKKLRSEAPIWRVAVYIRLSKEDGNEESLSVKNQRARLLHYLESSEDNFELVDVYADDGFTGTDSHREDFQRMLDDIRNGRINCVLVKDPSRLSRNYIEAGHYMEQLFVTHNVRFISLELPALDSYRHPEQMNSILVPLQNVINDDFCRQTSIKIRGVFNAKRRNGEFIGAFAPYGYQKDPENKNRLIIHEETAEIVRDIFSWFVHEGMSKGGIVRRLNEYGIPNPTRQKRLMGFNYHQPHELENSLWSFRTVDFILRNQVYIGDMVQGRQRIKSYKVHDAISVPEDEWFIVEHTHEPIIERALFEAAKELMSRNTRSAPTERKLYLFSGFLRCADCGRAMTRKVARKTYVYYACRTYTQESKTQCTKHSIREDRLTEAVLQALKVQIALVEDLEKIIEKINASENAKTSSNRLETMLKLRQRELDETKSILDGLFLDYKRGDLSRDGYLRMREKLEVKETELLSAIERIKEEMDTLALGVNQEDPYLSRFLQFKNLDRLERHVLVHLVKTIYVHEGGDITIEFAFADQYQRIVDFIENNRVELTVIKGKQVG